MKFTCLFCDISQESHCNNTYLFSQESWLTFYICPNRPHRKKAIYSTGHCYKKNEYSLKIFLFQDLAYPKHQKVIKIFEHKQLDWKQIIEYSIDLKFSKNIHNIPNNWKADTVSTYVYPFFSLLTINSPCDIFWVSSKLHMNRIFWAHKKSSVQKVRICWGNWRDKTSLWMYSKLKSWRFWNFNSCI